MWWTGYLSVKHGEVADSDGVISITSNDGIEQVHIHSNWNTIVSIENVQEQGIALNHTHHQIIHILNGHSTIHSSPIPHHHRLGRTTSETESLEGEGIVAESSRSEQCSGSIELVHVELHGESDDNPGGERHPTGPDHNVIGDTLDVVETPALVHVHSASDLGLQVIEDLREGLESTGIQRRVVPQQQRLGHLVVLHGDVERTVVSQEAVWELVVALAEAGTIESVLIVTQPVVGLNIQPPLPSSLQTLQHSTVVRSVLTLAHRHHQRDHSANSKLSERRHLPRVCVCTYMHVCMFLPLHKLYLSVPFFSLSFTLYFFLFGYSFNVGEALGPAFIGEREVHLDR